MESALGEFVSSHFVPFLAFALAVYILSAMIRKLAELCHPKLRDEELVRFKVWRELILPVTPIVIGALFALGIPQFPHPAEFREIWVARMMYGALLGFFSTWVYRVLKAIVQRKWQVELPDFDPAPTIRSCENSQQGEESNE